MAQAVLIGALATWVSWSLPASAQSSAGAEATVPRRPYSVPAGALDDALSGFARQAGITLAFSPSQVAGRRSAGLAGEHTLAGGLAALLAPHGLQAVGGPGGSFSIAPLAASATVTPAPPLPAAAASPAPELPAVRVQASAEPAPGEPPRPYAGGQVARGARAGLLGDRDYMETPYSISSYTDEALKAVEARTRLQVLELDPSVIRAIGAIEAQDQFLVRGFAIFGYQATVDGLPGLSGTTGRDTELYERIELTKGPSALLNGASSAFNVGGSVNLVTKYARDEPLTQLNLRWSEKSEVTTHLDVGRRFGPDNAFGVRTNLVYADGRRNVVDVGDEPRFKRQLYSLALDYRGERLRVRLHAYRLDDDQTVSGSLNGLSVAPQDPTQPLRRPVIGLRNTGVYRDAKAQTARVEWDLSPGTTATLNYGHSAGRTIQPYVGVEALDPDTGDATFRNGLYADCCGNAYVALATLNSRFMTGPVSHQLGLDVTRTWSKRLVGDTEIIVDSEETYQTNVFEQGTGPAPSLSLVPTGRSDGHTKAEYTYAIADTLGFLDDRLQVTAGVRRVESIEDTSPSFAVLFAVTPQVALYGNYIEGVQDRVTAPLNTSTPLGEQIDNPGEKFPPTPNKQKELGAKFDFGGLGATAALFEIEQIGYYRDPATRRYGPIGLQRNRGVEFNVFGEPWKGLRLLGGFAYIDALLKRTEDLAIQGNTAGGVPRRTLTLSGNWAVPMVPGLSLALRSRTQSQQFVDQTNAQRSGGYTVLSGGLAYATRIGVPVVVRASVENLTDKAYYVSFGRGRVDVGQPRTFTLSTQIDF